MLTSDQAQGIAKIFTQSLENELQTTRRVLAAVPPDKLEFKLGEKGRAAREIMWHIVESEAWFAEGICAGKFPEAETKEPAIATVDDILAWYDLHVPALLEKVKGLSGEQLANPLNFFNLYNLPAVMYLSFWEKHTVHHRGQLSAYLRAMNARVPDIYGGSADEPWQAPAGA